MGGIADWINPAKSLPAMFSSKTAFGLNPLNIGGKADPARDPFTAPGTTAKADAQSLVDEEAAANAKTIADAAAAKTKAASQAKETILSRQRSTSRNRSVFTNPLGLSGEASTIRKTLTGQ